MRETILEHKYLSGFLWDISPRRNHGISSDLSWKKETGVYFNGVSSYIEVPLQQDLSKWDSIEIEVIFQIDKAPQIRYNIVELHVVFSCFITSDLRIVFSFFDGIRWVSVRSSENAVELEKQHSLHIEYDGVSFASLTLDEKILKQEHNLSGNLQSPGPLGLWIGRWPDGERYLFQGYLSSLKIQKELLSPLKKSLLSKCCKKERDEKITNLFIQKGWELSQVEEVEAHFREANAKCARLLCKGDKESIDFYKREYEKLYMSVISSNREQTKICLEHLLEKIKNIPSVDALSLYFEGLRLLKMLPISLEDLLTFYEEECLLSELTNSILSILPENAPHSLADLKSQTEEIYLG